MTFNTFHRHRVCLVGRADLICSLCSWWEGLGSSLVTLPLGFNCGFISTSTCGSSTGVQLLRLPWRIWVCPSEGQVGGGAAAWVMGALTTPGTQSSRRLGQQEIVCSRRIWQPTPVFQPGEPPGQRSLAGHSPQGHKELAMTKVTPCAQTQDFF